MIILLFFLLALLYFIEVTTNISRSVGYKINNPVSGMVFQNSLSVFSRTLMFIFLPLLSYMSDSNSISINRSIYFTLLTPFLIFICIRYKRYIEKYYAILIIRISDNGSFLKSSKNLFKISFSRKKNVISIKMKFWILLLNLPYYLSWVIVLILLEKTTTYRATIISLSTFFNGIFIMGNSFIIDPYLTKLGKYKNVIISAYDEIIYLKLYSALIASIFILFFYAFFS